MLSQTLRYQGALAIYQRSKRRGDHMAVETTGGHPAMDYAEHTRTYSRFLRWTIGMIVFVVAVLLFLLTLVPRRARSVVASRPGSMRRCLPPRGDIHGHHCRNRGARGRAAGGRVARDRQEADRARRTVRVQAGAGARSRFSDELAEGAGRDHRRQRRRGAARVPISCSRCAGRRPDEVEALKPGAIVAAMLAPYDDRPGLDALAAHRRRR